MLKLNNGQEALPKALKTKLELDGFSLRLKGPTGDSG
jgi:hypothetical protein